MLLTRKLNKYTRERGGSLVEIVVVLGIIVGSLVVILGAASLFVVTSQLVQQTGEATLLAQELLEVVRTYRDGTDWSSGLGAVSLAPAVYYAEQSGSPPAWVLVSGSETVDIFTRSVQFEEVFRDASDNIATSGTSDDQSVQAIVTVSWEERGRSHEVQLYAYLTNWQE